MKSQQNCPSKKRFRPKQHTEHVIIQFLVERERREKKSFYANEIHCAIN